MAPQDEQQTPAPEQARPIRSPGVLMLGMGWFPSTMGGLDRYYRALLEQLPEARGVVLGPADGAPENVRAVSRHDRPLPGRLLAYTRAARDAARDGDIVDAHFALYGAAPLLLTRLRRRPAVFHFHGPWAEENVAVSDTSRLNFALRSRLERRVLRAADAHVVLSGAFGRVLVERYGVAPWDLHVWPPGVALDEFAPGDRRAARERLGLQPGGFVVACVRRLVPRMGIDVLLDAWSALASELPAGSTLLVVGDGPLAAELQARAASSAPPGSVRLLGRVSDEELVEVYRAADVAVVPTLAVEGFGLVVLEAAACGTPSIVTDVGGLPEAAAPLDGSLVVPPADAGALAARLRSAAAGRLPDRESTRRYAERFSWQALAGRHRELYSRLAARERDPRLRVVYVDHVARLSGGEIALLRLLPYMQGVNAHVILAEDGPLAQRLQQAGISVEVLPLPGSTRDLRRESVRLGAGAPRAALETLLYSARLGRRLRRLHPDLVHSNSLKSGVYGGIAARLAGVPLVWHLRDRIAEDYIPRSAVRMIGTAISRLARGVIANSTATQATLPPRAHRRSWVIPDSVEVPAAGPVLASSSAMTFGMLGRIAPWKGQDLFLRAFAAAFAEGEERAVIVGGPMFGEEDYERDLRALAAELGLDGRVEFRGFREDVWGELGSFDVLVHASVIPEPFGQVVIEGMAAGLPVIAPDEGGPADVIADGETGRLFRSRDSAALAEAMRALRTDAAERERLGTAARGAAAAFHPKVLAERFEAAYRRVLSGSGAG